MNESLPFSGALITPHSISGLNPRPWSINGDAGRGWGPYSIPCRLQGLVAASCRRTEEFIISSAWITSDNQGAFVPLGPFWSPIRTPKLALIRHRKILRIVLKIFTGKYIKDQARARIMDFKKCDNYLASNIFDLAQPPPKKNAASVSEGPPHS